ncbi:MAG: glutathione-regulated potassium-efflux system protein [Rhodospirillales bacterium]|nr:glutathione-regulated potassium-efflux system protein [Rhodospirillales bacterium]
MPHSLPTETLIVIAASVCAVGILTRAGLPAALGYLIAGLAIGPHGLHLLAASDETRFLAELGIIFLMFMVGLEFSLPTIIAARRNVFGAGILQVGITTLMVAGIATLFAVPLFAAIVLGGAMAMSSTAIALKQLADQDELGSEHGRLAVGILLFQDLATIPFLVMVSAREEAEGASILRDLAVAALALGLTILVSRPIFRVGLSWVSGTNSPDLFLLSVGLLALGAAFAVHLAGLNPAIGAFLAGMVIGESDFRHKVEDDVRPFRDVLLGLFFVTVGMEIDPSSIAVAPFATIGWILVLLLGKMAATGLVAPIMHWPAHTAVRLATILAHAGEFGLLLITQAIAAGVIAPQEAQPALFAVAATMGLAPLFIQRNASIAQLFLGAASRRAAAAQEDGIRQASNELRDHILLCGCGRVGQLVALVLGSAKLPYLAIETDHERFREATRRGFKVVFGDASHRRILAAAGLSRARLLVVTFDRRPAVERLLDHARHENPTLPAIVSAADDRQISALVNAGAAAVFPENLAAGLALADQALLMAGYTQEEAAKTISAVRAELNPELLWRVRI